ncbi:MAG: phosphoglycerate kinase [Alphaproteobacteria bacterium]|nr:phosphoglycerate kinase [Alphaproteobacteria bacterium]
MSGFKTLDRLTDDLSAGSIVLIRADLNVPLDDNGAVRDATRLARLLPSLQKLSEAGYRIGVLSHFGRPKGQPNDAMSLAPVADALAGLIKQDISFAADCIGAAAQTALSDLPEGGICVLENTRFHAGEEADDSAFAQALAAPAAAYINDAFSAAHRAHASTHGITEFLPTYCGLAMQAELEALDAALGTPNRPLIALVGGAKVSTKLSLLGNLSAKVDKLVIGGGMANTFLAAQGHAIGTSLCEDTMLDTARDVMAEAEAQGCEIMLPRDAVIAAEFAAGQSGETVAVDAVPDDKMILDAGGDAVADICAAFDAAATLIWNGPLGAFEIEPFDTATNRAAQHAAMLTKKGQLTSVAGGGDTVAALNHAGAGDDFSYVSTAGGAFLEWLEGKTLPGVAALDKSQ